VEELGRIRMTAMEEFLSDYPQGLEQGRYVQGELPLLAFADKEFDLAVCSHLLFLYSEHLSEDFHMASIRELSRVAKEVRIFPLLELGAKISRHLRNVTDRLSALGYAVTTVPVSYEFQRGGNQMMVIT
jgi:ubiquinone/menaquinone biosynthesis C-methylase UbiE